MPLPTDPRPPDDEPLPLQGLYLYLLRAGFPLSVRDYEDALRAVRLGYGVGTRAALLSLCSALWARGDEEQVRIRAVFKGFAKPTRGEVERLSGHANAPATPGANGADGTTAQRPADAAAGPATPTAPRAVFAAASESGVALPSVRTGGRAQRAWLLEPRPPLLQRALVVAWRRYRVAQRSGPPVELDIAATVAAQSRIGWLLHPVLVPARCNQARLVVLVDVSPSMVPWHGLNEPMAESLRQGRLGHVSLYYFDNDPLNGLYETAELGGPSDFDAVLRENGDGALLVVSDAGSARGRRDRPRAAGMREFARRVRHRSGRLAWLNPMPRERWGDAARPLLPWALMCELSDDGLTHAVDFLRGTKTA